MALLATHFTTALENRPTESATAKLLGMAVIFRHTAWVAVEKAGGIAASWVGSEADIQVCDRAITEPMTAE